jgi:imidazoleglycerol-phosphate dehydratase
MKKRMASVARKTRETDIRVRVDIDGQGTSKVSTGIPFLNHMLELLAKHSLIDLAVSARGDLDVDYHHTVEDIGLALGAALDQALGDRRGIVRYGFAAIPMDEALAQAAVDLGGRPYLVSRMACRSRKIRDFDLKLVTEFFQAFVVQGRLNLHVQQAYGDEPHHACEAVFKAVARALRQACACDPREKGVPSSKGRI